MTSVACGIVFFGISKFERYLVDRTGRDLQWAAMEIAEKINLLLVERYGDMKIIKVFSRKRDTKSTGETLEPAIQEHSGGVSSLCLDRLRGQGRSRCVASTGPMRLVKKPGA
ncbi:MAG: hypothetical protein MRJ68_12940 [Nitrospira sp.]|nr:hypothetical protein [Nitrospira sp.]